MSQITPPSNLDFVPVTDSCGNTFNPFVDGIKQKSGEVISISAERLRKYFRYRNPVQDTLDSYNAFISEELPKIMMARAPTFTRSDGTVIRIIFTMEPPPRPSATENDATIGMVTRPIWPNAARTRSEDYSIRVHGGAIFQRLDPADGNWITIGRSEKMRELFRVPCAIRSKYCNTYEKTPTQLAAVRETPGDPGGYFIIEGLERWIPYVDKLRYNQIFVLPPDDKKSKKKTNPSKMFCKQTLLTPTGSIQMKIMLGELNQFRMETISFDSIPSDKKVGNSVNILHMIAFMLIYTPFRNEAIAGGNNPISKYLLSGIGIGGGVNFDASVLDDSPNFKNRIVQIFKLFLTRAVKHKSYRADVLLAFNNTITDFNKVPIKSVFADLTGWLKVSTKSPNDQLKAYNLVCTRDIFPQASPSQMDTKIWLFAILAARLSRVLAGIDSLSSRDSWSHKLLSTNGEVMARIAKKCWRLAVDAIDSNLSSDNNKDAIRPDTVIEKFPSGIVTEGITNYLKNNAASSRTDKKTIQVTEILERNNLTDIFGQLTKITTDINTNSKNPLPRAVQGGGLGNVCPVTTPDSQDCGYIKNKALASNVTINVDPAAMIRILKEREIIIPYRPRGHPDNYDTLVMVNGIYEGWADGQTARREIVALRRQGLIDKFTAVVMSPYDFLEIYTDAGRLSRALLIADENVPGKTKLEVDDMDHLSFQGMIDNGYAEFLDPYEEESADVVVAADQKAMDMYVALLKSYKDQRDVLTESLELVADQAERNIAISRIISYDRRIGNMEAHPYTHSSIHPAAMYSTAAFMEVFSNHAATCRVSYAAKMEKQALSILSDVYTHHSGLSLASSNHPLVSTALNEELGIRDLPVGHNMIVAFMALPGNEEDALIVDKGFIQSGSLNFRRRIQYKATLESSNDYRQEFRRPVKRMGPNGHDYTHALNRQGLPAIGADVAEGDYIIGIVQINTNTTPPTEEYHPSIRVEAGEKGTVKDVVIRASGGKVRISVIIDYTTEPQVGDKLNSHAQKVVIGRIVDIDDMPVIAYGPNAAMRPNAIINIHAMPTRMTINYFLEQYLGLAAAITGEFYDATAFEDFTYEKFYQMMVKRGYDGHGESRMINGRTGHLMPGYIFMGPIYYRQLPHIAEQNLYGRGWSGHHGARDPFSGQAVSGRQRGGGLKLGEMEHFALRGNKAVEISREALMVNADAFEVVLCRSCGAMSNYRYGDDEYVCPTCPGEKGFGIITIPYVLKLIQQLLYSTGIALTLIPETNQELIDRLRQLAVSV